MTEREIIMRKIVLKKQLIKLTEGEINVLEDEIKKVDGGKT
jgi:hypothetical protein